MDVIQAIQTKRAVRAYTDQPVPEEIIRQILDAGRRAQSSRNLQPWTFVVVQDKERLARLADTWQYAAQVKNSAFTIVLVSSDPWMFDIGQAAAYLQLAAWELGVSSGLVYIGDQDLARQILNVPAEQHLEMMIAFGYAREAPPAKTKASGRKPLDEVVRWETWD
jgi:nitroreductase